MIASRSVEIIYWTTGIYVVHENEDSYFERLSEAEAPLIRRCLMTKQAAEDYKYSPETSLPKRLETARFAKKALTDLLNFELPRRRWLGINGYTVPFPSVRPT